MKKSILILCMLLCLSFLGCKTSKTMHDVIENEPHFTGIVTEYHENSYIIVETDASITDEHGIIVVPLDVELSDSMTHFSVGDEVTVYYDGNYKETSPVELTKVYAILLITPLHRESDSST